METRGGHYKPTLSVDFDGVLHSYTSDWQGVGYIPDPPVPGAIEFLTEAIKHFDVAIYSSRSEERAGRWAMADALVRWGLPKETLDHLEFPMTKPKAFLTLDDRCMLFSGVFPNPESLLAFKPWNQK